MMTHQPLFAMSVIQYHSDAHTYVHTHNDESNTILIENLGGSRYEQLSAMHVQTFSGWLSTLGYGYRTKSWYYIH